MLFFLYNLLIPLIIVMVVIILGFRWIPKGILTWRESRKIKADKDAIKLLQKVAEAAENDPMLNIGMGDTDEEIMEFLQKTRKLH